MKNTTETPETTETNTIDAQRALQAEAHAKRIQDNKDAQAAEINTDPAGAYVKEFGKSKSTSVWLTVIFGGFGLLYANIFAGIGMIILQMVVFSINPLFVIGAWIVEIILSVTLIDAHNDKMKRQYEFQQATRA